MNFILLQTMNLIQYELTIYVFSILFVLFDIFIITKIVLLLKKKGKINIDWWFASVNIFNFILSYIFLIITYLMLFIPSLFSLIIFSNDYSDALHNWIIVLFVTYFFRYLILLLTIKYSCFIANENKIILINHDLSFHQIIKITNKKIVILVSLKNEKHFTKTKIFLKKSKLSSILLKEKLPNNQAKF